MNQQNQGEWTFLFQNIIVPIQNHLLFDLNQELHQKQSTQMQMIDERHRTIEEGTIEKYLNIKKKEDYLIRISQIVRIFEIDSKFIGTFCMMPQQLNFYLNKKKQVGSSIEQSNIDQSLFFAQYLYAVKSIIVRVQKIKVGSQNSMNLFIFDTAGPILAIFLHCLNLRKIIKSFKEKFRNIKTMFWVQKTSQRTADLKQFLTFQQQFQYQMFGLYVDQNQDMQNVISSPQKASSLMRSQNRYFAFNYNSFIVLSRQFKTLKESDIKMACNICSMHEKFYGNFFKTAEKSNFQEKNLLRKKTIFIRLSAAYFNNFLKYKKSALDNYLLEQLHKQIIIQLMMAKKQFMKQKIFNAKNLGKHQPVNLNSCGKLCVYCRKKKTIYKCFGCTALFQKDVPLCVLCFFGYHCKENIGSYVPRSSQKQQMRDRESLRLSQITANNNQPVQNLAAISDPQTLQRKLQLSQEAQESQTMCYKKFISDCDALMKRKKEGQFSIFKKYRNK